MNALIEILCALGFLLLPQGEYCGLYANLSKFVSMEFVLFSS